MQTEVDGKFIQAQLPDTGMFPLGILRDPFTCRKAFYVAVAFGGAGRTEYTGSAAWSSTPNPDPSSRCRAR